KKRLLISKEAWPEKLRTMILPLTRLYPVEFDRNLIREIRDGEPEKKVHLQEKGDYLLFQPVFSYKGYETRAGEKEEIVVPDGDKVLIVHRNKQTERRFIEKLEALHSNFLKPEGSDSLVLKGSDVLKNNWFFL